MSNMSDLQTSQEIDMLKQQISELRHEIEEIKETNKHNIFNRRIVAPLPLFGLYLFWCFFMLLGAVVSLILLRPGLNVHPVGIMAPTFIGAIGPVLISRPLYRYFLSCSRKQNIIIAGLLLVLSVLNIGLIIRIWMNGSII